MAIDKTGLDVYITPWQAARQLGQNTDAVGDLIRSGKLHAAVMTDGTVGVSQQSLNTLLPRESLPEYREFADLRGAPIHINEAARKYGLNTSTLTRWMQRGLVHQVGKAGRKTLLDEADVAYCAKIYQQNSGQGKWAFDSGGRPYSK